MQLLLISVEHEGFSNYWFYLDVFHSLITDEFL